ncbi:hypothetical protein H0H92_005154 [Tricholoma furcatifolium]|nr:hypothetical protein H0H92_005154 [Tricholoma furcatifolium]
MSSVSPFGIGRRSTLPNSIRARVSRTARGAGHGASTPTHTGPGPGRATRPPAPPPVIPTPLPPPSIPGDGGSGATEGVAGGLYLLGELFSTIPGLRAVLNSPSPMYAESKSKFKSASKEMTPYDPRRGTRNTRTPRVCRCGNSQLPAWLATTKPHPPTDTPPAPLRIPARLAAPHRIPGPRAEHARTFPGKVEGGSTMQRSAGLTSQAWV